MIKQLWWVALAMGLACSSSGQSSSERGSAAQAPGNATDLDPAQVDPGASARDELRLLETETGLVVQIERDGQLIERSCAGTCGDVCTGCLLEACQLSSAPALCNAAADACENRCNVCMGVNTQLGTCDVPSCAGNLSCYFATVGVPEEFRDVVRGVSGEPGSQQPLSPQPGTSDPVDRAATPADPSAADPSERSAGEPSSGEGGGAEAY